VRAVAVAMPQGSQARREAMVAHMSPARFMTVLASVSNKLTEKLKAGADKARREKWERETAYEVADELVASYVFKLHSLLDLMETLLPDDIDDESVVEL
jgi:hypothetical protein